MSVVLQLNGPHQLSKQNLQTVTGLGNAGVFVLAKGSGATFAALYAAKTGNTPLQEAIESAAREFTSAEHFWFQICTASDQDELLKLAKRQFNL